MTKYCQCCGIELTEENTFLDNPDFCKDCADNELDEDLRKMICSVCGKEISVDEADVYDGKCFECFDDELTEEEEEK